VTGRTIARASRPQVPRIARIALIAVVAALLAGACGNPPNPSPTTSASPPVSPSASSSATGAACADADITATGGPWGGAAGSRGSDIMVTNAGAVACVLPAGPTVAMVDQGGTVVLANTPPQSGAGPSLAAGSSIGFSLVIGNWCDQQVSLPLHFSLALAAGAVDIGGLFATTLDDLPPCNGPGQPATISTTAWQPS
jgi:hypothetical protein